MNTIHLALTTLALAAAGIAQASEITDFPLEKSTRSRTEVRAEVQRGSLSMGELYDGSHLAAKPAAAPAHTRSRDEVRKEAAAARRMPVSLDTIGGV